MIEIKNEYVIECGGCGVKFLTSNKNRKHCSNACKAKAYRGRKIINEYQGVNNGMDRH